MVQWQGLSLGAIKGLLNRLLGNSRLPFIKTCQAEADKHP